MSNNWPKVKLGEVVTPADRVEVLTPGTSYRQIGVKLWGEGAYERETIDGAQTKYARLFRAEAGDIIVNKIWARNGSVAVVPRSLSGCYGSGEFPMYTPRADRLDPQWMHWLTKTADFWALCDEKSRGTSGKNRIRPEQFLRVEIPLPPLVEQRGVVARIEELSAKIEEAGGLRKQAEKDVASVVAAGHRNVFNVLAQRHGKFRIDSFAEVKGGKRLPRGERLVDFDTGFPYIRAGNLKDGTVRGDILFLPPELQTSIAQYIVVAGEVYITIVGACIGDVGIIPNEFHNANLTENAAKITIRDEKSVHNKFLVHALRSPEIQEQLANKRTIAAQPKLALHRIRSTKIPLPPLTEQRRIVAYFDDLQQKADSLKALQTETAAELDALMPSILDKAFRGAL